ncbi:MAG: DUF5916 domain-containing protein [Candidatus Zixiibacteriota bacterium]
MKAIYVTEPPKIDGKLDDVCWLKQEPITDFVTMYPVQGEKPAFHSKVRIAYDNQNLYVAFETILPESLKVTARTLKRDDAEVNYDDCAFIYLDCMNDRRSCYFFGVNALNSQYDGHAEAEGSKMDLKWDGIWQSATSYSLHAWSCEFAIPFRILRYDPKAPRWGINFLVDLQGRQIGYWSETGMNPAGVSKYGNLVGLEQIQARTHVNLFPYLAFNHDKYAEKEDKFQAGLDVKSDLTNALTLNLTLNPEFALIEADVDTFNLLPQERLIPEKRPFFLEGLELFKTPITLLYTRSIGSRRERQNPVDILGGAKLVGRVAGLSLGALNVATDRADGIPREDYSAFRLQKDILKSSTIGLLATSTHELKGDGLNDSRWIDGALAFDSYLSLGKDFGLYPLVSVIHHPHGDDKKDRWAYYLACQRLGSAPLQFDLKFQDIAENCTTSTSYIPYTDIKGGSAYLSYSWWVRKHGFYNLNPYGSYDYYENHDHKKTQQHFYLGFGSTLTNMTDVYLTRYEYLFKFPKYRRPYQLPYDFSVTYDYWELYLGTHTWKSVVGSITYGIGTQYYLFDVPGMSTTKFVAVGDKYFKLRPKSWDNSYRHLAFSSQIKPIDRLQLIVTLENVHFDFLSSSATDTSSSEWIVSARSHLLIIPQLSFKAFYQDDRKDQTTDLNLLLEYNYLPGSYIYLAYNHNENLVMNPGEVELSKRKEDLFFVKTDYWFSF